MAIRIVFADDHVLVCQSLESLLEREGFRVSKMLQALGRKGFSS